MKIKQIAFSTSFFKQIYLEEGIQEICSTWTLQSFFGAGYKKDLSSQKGYIFKLVGNELECPDGRKCFESALFVKIGCGWMLVSGSSMVFSSNNRVNEIAREIEEHIKDSKIDFERASVVNLVDTAVMANQVG